MGKLRIDVIWPSLGSRVLDRSGLMARLRALHGEEDDCDTILFRDMTVYEESLYNGSLSQILEEDAMVLAANLKVATRRLKDELGSKIRTEADIERLTSTRVTDLHLVPSNMCFTKASGGLYAINGLHGMLE